MDIEDLEPRKTKPKPKDLEVMGVDELENYLAELKAEVERVESEIAGKRDYKAGLNKLFKR